MPEAPAAVTFRTSDDNSVVCLCTKNRVDGAIAQVMAQRVLRPWVARTGLSPQHLSVLLAAAGLFLWLGPVLVAPPHPGFRVPLALGLSVWLMYNLFQSWTLRDRRPLDQLDDTLPPHDSHGGHTCPFPLDALSELRRIDRAQFARAAHARGGGPRGGSAGDDIGRVATLRICATKATTQDGPGPFAGRKPPMIRHNNWCGKSRDKMGSVRTLGAQPPSVGHMAPENRESQAVCRCRPCGYCANADVNTAVNILAAGLAVTGRGGTPHGQPALAVHSGPVKRQPSGRAVV